MWIDNYRPLVVMFEPSTAKQSLSDAVVFRNGRPYEYGVSIQNNGRFTVRALGAPRSVTNALAGHLLMSKPSENLGGPLVPFHPFDLPPGEISSLILRRAATPLSEAFLIQLPKGNRCG